MSDQSEEVQPEPTLERRTRRRFKTAKYWPTYPGRFRDDEHAR